jgi:PAS domain S-box-containing protein
MIIESAGWKILLIDDDQDLCETMAVVLRDAGCKVFTANDGEKGIALCKDHSPQIVITDYSMPGINGIQVLEEVKRFDPNIEVIVITGFGEISIALSALRLNASDFINKPVSDDALLIAVSRAQHRFALNRQARAAGPEGRGLLPGGPGAGFIPFSVDLIANAMDGAIACDEKDMIIAYNRRMEKMLGYPEAEIIHKMKMDRLFTLKDRDRFIRDLTDSRYGGKNRLSCYETRLISKDGHVIPVQMSATQLLDGKKKSGRVCFFKDLRERKILSDQWVKLLDQLNIGSFTIDLDRRITSFNQSVQSLTGLKTTEAIGRDCRRVFSDVPCTEKCPSHVTGTPEDETVNVEITDRKDVKHLVTRISTPIYGADDAIVGCLTVLQDHAALAELINRVNYEERSLKMILDNLDIGIFTVNRGGLITFFNRAAEIVSGFNRKQVLGRPCNIIFGEDSVEDSEMLKESISLGELRTNTNSRLVTQEGEIVPIRADYIPLHDEQNKIVGGLATIQDLTLIHQLDQMISGRYSFHNMIGRDPEMQKIFRIVEVAAASDATILIKGETGTGKDLLAKIVHSASSRREKAFVKVNCAALPDNLLESELFGYRKGAFTGADRDKPGRFQEADQGTILLDEIGDLPLNLQAKLLRVLEDKEFYPLGSSSTKKVDVRIVSATNRDIEELISRRLFREDLYYRLNVIQVTLPSLRERRADIPLLIRHILRKLCSTHNVKSCEISKEALRILLNYHYPGNVRELQNLLEHAVIVCQGNIIKPEHLPVNLRNHIIEMEASPYEGAAPRKKAMNDERQQIMVTLEAHDWHRGKTAAALHMDRTTLWRKMISHGIHKKM